MKLTILGTGNAAVTECYNTCFLLTEGADHLLVDAGGGNGIFRQLKAAGVRWQDIRSIFVTHKHLDHITGILWLIRILRTLTGLLLSEKEIRFLGSRLRLVTVENGESLPLLGQTVTFFDIGSTKAAQFGFSITLPGGGKLTCCGDEPFNEAERPFAGGSRWLLHEAFCLASEADVFKPYQKHHSTVADACRLAQELGAENLILYHTEDKNLARRKALYTAEGAPLFSGNLFVPEDLETFEL